MDSYQRIPVLRVFPTYSLNDEHLHIKAVGLRPYQRVTLRAHVFTESGRRRFESQAHYHADDHGLVEVEKAPSLGGSYRGIEPMGLLWSLEPSPEIANEKPRLIKRNVQKPFIYTFQLVDGVENKVMHSISVERWYLASYVERHLVQHGTAEGCLYIPKKKGSSDPMPVILDIRGNVPFLVEDRPSLMASHGFAVFSINYFTNSVKQWDMFNDKSAYFDLNIFLSIFDFISRHPRLDSSRVGIVSSCYGSVIALHATARLKNVIPIQCIAATGCVDCLAFNFGLRLPDGTTIEPCNVWDHYERLEDAHGYFTLQINNINAFDNLNGDFKVPIEEVSCPMLFITLGDDMQLPSHKRMNVMKQRIEKAGKHHLLETIHLEGAGHFIDAPYLPLCKENMNGVLRASTRNGGEPRLHAYALNKAWRKTINWFRSQLNVAETYRVDWLDTSNSFSSSKL